MGLNLLAKIRQNRKNLQLDPEEIDTSKLAPLFVPASFFALGNWPGPYTRLRAAAIRLTWAVLQPDQTMRYVDFSMSGYWDKQGLDWRALALSNLAEHSGPQVGTHLMQRSESQVYAVAFMHADGIGPSRLLLRDELAAFFPAGYRVALPEMSCAVAFSADATEPEMAILNKLIDNCHRKGARPLSPDIYLPDDLLPEA